jgi:hypothetical protein
LRSSRAAWGKGTLFSKTLALLASSGVVGSGRGVLNTSDIRTEGDLHAIREYIARDPAH